MRKPIPFYDIEYFGHTTVKCTKSNYQKLGGYVDAFAKAEHIVDTVISILPTVNKVLEIGCAHGATVRLFNSKGIQCYGVDCSEYILSVAADDVKNMLYFGDMHSLPTSVIKLAPFDIICSKDVLEHSDEESISQLITQFGRLCTMQVHWINTNEYDYQLAGYDKSHTLLKPLTWWVDLFNTNNLKAILYAT